MTAAAIIAAGRRAAGRLRAWRGDVSPVLVGVLAAALGLGLSAAVTLLTYSADQHRMRVEFAVLAENRRLLTQDGLRDIEQAMEAVGELFELSRSRIDRAAFEAMTQSALEQTPGVGAIAWIPHPAAGQNHPAGSAADPCEHFRVLYVTGRLAAAIVPGTDLAADPDLSPLCKRARRSTGIVASLPVDRAVGSGRIPVVYLLMPIDTYGMAGGIDETQARSLAGFVAFLIDPEAAIRQIHRGVTSPRGLDFYFYDADAAPSASPLFVRSSFLRAGPAPPLPRGTAESGLHASYKLALGDGHWLMVVRPLPGGPLSTQSGRTWIVLASGLAITGLAAAWAAAARNHARRLTAMLAILDAVAAAAIRLTREPQLDKAIPEALETAGRAVDVDRVLLITGAPGAALVLRYGWQAETVPLRVDAALFSRMPAATPERDNWLAPLRAGRFVAARLSTARGAVRDLLVSLKIRSLLIVPVMVDGTHWGQIGFDDCKRERRWGRAEIDALQTLAELVGSSVARAGRIAALADADRIVQNSPTVLYRVEAGPGLPMTYVSQNVSRLLGYGPARFIEPGFYQSLVHPEDRERVAALTQSSTQSGEALAFEFRIAGADGSYRWFEHHAAPRRDQDGRLLGIEGLMIDTTERKAAEAKIAALARTDPLTGLANRAAFLDRLGLVFAGARRGGPGFAVLCLDLDHFKEINDSYGHPAGDELLRIIAHRLATGLRETDLAARFGGDEFVVLQADLGDPTAAAALAQKLCATVASPCRLDGSEVRISASIGIATYSATTAAPEEMLAQADRALYLAKTEGRDRYRFHAEALDAAVRTQVALAAELRTALAEGQFELCWQPQVAVRTGAIVGLKALVRWNHPKRGLLDAAAFLPTAARTGLILPLGRWILDHTCRQLQAWRREGLTPPVVSVSVSRAQLKLGAGFAREVAAMLEKWGLAGGDLEFDVGEAVLLDLMRGHPETVDGLRQLGVGIAIENFGSEATAIGRLRAARIKRLEIAPEFMVRMTSGPDNGAKLRTITELADKLEFEIVAEGVETQPQGALPADVGKAERGLAEFHLHPPMPTAQTTRLLREFSASDKAKAVA